MGKVLFYHLTRSGADETMRNLMDRALAQGWRVMVRGTDAAALARIDARLWLEPDDGFLPHGVQGGAQDADQPVLIGQGKVVNGAQALFLIDGAEVTPAEVQALERVWVLFDGDDEGRLAQARGQWRAVTAAGLVAEYWSEDSGRWQMKAASGGT